MYVYECTYMCILPVYTHTFTMSLLACTVEKVEAVNKCPQPEEWI